MAAPVARKRHHSTRTQQSHAPSPRRYYSWTKRSIVSFPAAPPADCSAASHYKKERVSQATFLTIDGKRIIPIWLRAVLWRCEDARKVGVLSHWLGWAHWGRWQRLGTTSHHIHVWLDHLLGDWNYTNICGFHGFAPSLLQGTAGLWKIGFAVRLLKGSNCKATNKRPIKVNHLMRHTNYRWSTRRSCTLKAVVNTQGLFLARSQCRLICNDD